MEGLQVKRFLHAVLCVILFSACASAQAPCRYDPQSGLFTGGDGKPYSGVVRGYYPDGALRSFSEVKEGRLNGRQVLYYADGSVERAGTFREGRSVGPVRIYEAGRLVMEADVADGAFDGTAISYDAEGEAVQIRRYRRGKLEGRTEIANTTGGKWGEILFRDDKPVEGFCYDAAGKKLRLSEITMRNVLNGARGIPCENE